jgi:hypothetical protein
MHERVIVNQSLLHQFVHVEAQLPKADDIYRQVHPNETPELIAQRQTRFERKSRNFGIRRELCGRRKNDAPNS